jgi:hypothetical protein
MDNFNSEESMRVHHRRVGQKEHQLNTRNSVSDCTLKQAILLSRILLVSSHHFNNQPI